MNLTVRSMFVCVTVRLGCSVCVGYAVCAVCVVGAVVAAKLCLHCLSLFFASVSIFLSFCYESFMLKPDGNGSATERVSAGLFYVKMFFML